MEQEKLIEKFEKEFKEMKQELGFKSSLKDIDEIFFVKDFILRTGFVSSSLSRQVCANMKDLLGAWYNYFHTIVMPNPGSMLNMTESQAFLDQEKQELMILMNKIMSLMTDNTMNGLSKNKDDESKFIDECVAFWKNELKPKAQEVMKKVKSNWVEKSEDKEVKQ